MKYLVIITILLITQSDLSGNLTEIKVNEKLELYKKYENIDGYAYFFVSYPACQSCLDNMETLISYLNKNGNYDIKIFLSGISSEYLEDVKKEKKWNAEIILDKIGAYHKYYKMNKTNSILIIDDKSILKYIACFSEKFDLQEFNNTLTEIKKSNKADLKIPKSIIFKIDTNSLFKNFGVLGLYSEIQKKYFLCQINDGLFYISDSIGSITQTIDIKEHLKINRLRLVQMSWRIKNKSILIQIQKNEVYKMSNILMEYDIIKDSLYKVDFDSEFNNEMIDIYGNCSNEGYAICRRYETKLSEFDTNHILLINYDKNINIIASNNKNDDIYKKFDLKRSFRQFIDFSNSEIYSLQMFSKNILVYDENLNLKKQIQLEKSNTNREVKEGLPSIKSKSDWVGFSSRNSYYQYLRLNSTDSLILLGYFNYSIPDGVNDLESPGVKNEWFYDIFDFTGKLIKNIHIKESFPWIIYFDDNRVAYIHTTDNIVRVNWIELDD